jgi:hypothetical protein
MANILKWKVDEAPTGRYRSFQSRGWPSAEYKDGRPAAAIYCEDSYEPANARTGKHAPLSVRVADHSVTPWKWRTVKQRFATLQEAKDGITKLLEQFPKFGGTQ